MGSKWLAVTVMVVTPVWVSMAEAGVYSTIEPKWQLNDRFRVFQEQTLTPLKQLAASDPNLTLQPWQKNYYLAATALLLAPDPPSRGKPDAISPYQRLDFGSCLLRIREPGKAMPEKAILHLNAAVERDRDNYLVMSTLATAYQMSGDYQRASDWLSEALRYWNKGLDQLSPKQKEFFKETQTKDPPKWRQEDFDWYAKCEKYQQQLVRLRLREKASGSMASIKTAAKQLDALFDPLPMPKDYEPLRFVGESGSFEPGKIAAAQKAKLPADAVQIVEQLLIWTPDDLRLFWLLGELLNAAGDPESTLVFKEIFDKFLQQTPELQGLGGKNDEDLKKELVSRFVQKYPEVGGHYQTLLNVKPSAPFAAEAVAPVATKKNDELQSQDKKPAELPVAPFNLDLRALGVGLAGGLLAGFLIAWRLRDVLRRRSGYAVGPTARR